MNRGNEIDDALDRHRAACRRARLRHERERSRIAGAGMVLADKIAAYRAAKDARDLAVQVASVARDEELKALGFREWCGVVRA